jgi:hypothetical protein
MVMLGTIWGTRGSFAASPRLHIEPNQCSHQPLRVIMIQNLILDITADSTLKGILSGSFEPKQALVIIPRSRDNLFHTLLSPLQRRHTLLQLPIHFQASIHIYSASGLRLPQALYNIPLAFSRFNHTVNTHCHHPMATIPTTVRTQTIVMPPRNLNCRSLSPSRYTAAHFSGMSDSEGT